MAEKGLLTVFVTTARMAIPIKNAAVSFFEADSKKLLGFRRSNEEGKTQVFEIETPDTGLSLSPQNGNEVKNEPFRVLDVQVNHPMYQSILIEDVQIFPGRESIQNADLIPLSEYANAKDNTEIFPITPQNL